MYQASDEIADKRVIESRVTARELSGKAWSNRSSTANAPAMTPQTQHATTTPSRPIAAEQSTESSASSSLMVAKWLAMGIKLEPAHIQHLLDANNRALLDVIARLSPLHKNNEKSLDAAIAVSGEESLGVGCGE